MIRSGTIHGEASEPPEVKDQVPDRATLETEDGHRIAAHIDGVGTPRANEPIVDLAENARLTTAAPKYD